MKRYIIALLLFNASEGFSQDTLDCGGKIVVFTCNFIKFDSIAFSKYDNQDLPGKWVPVKIKAKVPGKDSLLPPSAHFCIELFSNREGFIYYETDSVRKKEYWFYVPHKKEIHFMSRRKNDPKEIFTASGNIFRIKKLNKRRLVLLIVRGRKNIKYTLTFKRQIMYDPMFS